VFNQNLIFILHQIPYIQARSPLSTVLLKWQISDDVTMLAFFSFAAVFMALGSWVTIRGCACRGADDKGMLTGWQGNILEKDAAELKVDIEGFEEAAKC
jgi:hypothetical protein